MSSRDERHELTGSKIWRIAVNVEKLGAVFLAHDTNFEESG